MDLPIQAGVVIVATGADEWKPAGIHGYGADPRVMTQGELEQALLAGTSGADEQQPDQPETFLSRPVRSVVMIQCVGARDENRPYCGRICCLTAMKNAILLKEWDPSIEVHILYRDIEVHGTHFEDYYGRARDQGVIFTRYTPSRPPQVSSADGRVLVYDEMLGMRLGIPYDLLLLSTPLVAARGASDLGRMLKVPVDEFGFFLEAHVKLRPLDFATDGVYLCGSAHWPAHLDEAISQAYGAAARAATVLSRDQIRASGVVARADEYLCRGCELCAEVCEFGAIEFVELDTQPGHGLHFTPPRTGDGVADQGSGRIVARVNPVLCKGCGACAVVCPTCAMEASHFTSMQVTAMVQAAFQG
jgi:heterodisulfide reductase subunit A